MVEKNTVGFEPNLHLWRFFSQFIPEVEMGNNDNDFRFSG
jgi:serine/threonine protein kinase HipA of HipAB toxin-antitoxin module